MLTCHCLYIKMTRFMNRFRINLQICVTAVTIIVLLYYMTHFSSCSDSIASPPKFSPQSSLFLIPNKRKLAPSRTIPYAVQSKLVHEKCSVTVALILCEDDRYLSIKNTTHRTTSNASGDIISNYKSKPPVAKDFSRQINQTLVLLKSIALLSKFASKGSKALSCVSVLILSDKPNHHVKIKEAISEWSPEFQQALQVLHIPVRYPPGSAWMRKMFRPCATLRLFLAELLPGNHDSIIYLDTDVIFFQSVQALWREFERFDKYGSGSRSKVAAMAPCLFHYGSPANSVPYYGRSGLNAGIMLMNLTRMRGTQWTNKVRMVTTMFQNRIKLADQDILNIYFHFFPEELHVLSCDWNFRPFQCREGSYCEDTQMYSRGISALHGNALSFTPQGPEPLFHAVYQTYHRTKLDGKFNIKKFVDLLESMLLKAEEKSHSECKRFGGFNVMLLNRLYAIVER